MKEKRFTRFSPSIQHPVYTKSECINLMLHFVICCRCEQQTEEKEKKKNMWLWMCTYIVTDILPDGSIFRSILCTHRKLWCVLHTITHTHITQFTVRFIFFSAYFSVRRFCFALRLALHFIRWWKLYWKYF